MQVELAVHTSDERSTHLVWTLPVDLGDLTFGYLYNAVEDAIKMWLHETNVELPFDGQPTNSNVFECPLCTDPPRSFDTKQGLNMHLRRVHSKNGW